MELAGAWGWNCGGDLRRQGELTKEILAWLSVRMEGHARRSGPRHSLLSECDLYSHPVEEEVA
jgi:hypothetical protein